MNRLHRSSSQLLPQGFEAAGPVVEVLFGLPRGGPGLENSLGSVGPLAVNHG